MGGLAQAASGEAARVPEPLQFDLVRGLESQAGEIEVNTLVNVVLPQDGSPRVRAAPELEVTLLRGVSVELELPFEAFELVGTKGAAQLTLPGSTKGFVHGLQGIGEYRLASRDVEGSALYVLGARAGASSLLAMGGARARPSSGGTWELAALVNLSVFFDVSRSFTCGLETNTVLPAQGEPQLLILPQIHLELTSHWKLQLGAGGTIERGSFTPLAATRVIFD